MVKRFEIIVGTLFDVTSSSQDRADARSRRLSFGHSHRSWMRTIRIVCPLTGEPMIHAAFENKYGFNMQVLVKAMAALDRKQGRARKAARATGFLTSRSIN
jgi:hypothetical protein